MGRQRSIDRDAVLNAAERVVIRDGAANLTLEAVAAEAGISKASVLYDYKTKRALIRTLIERRVAAEEELIQRFVDAHADRPDARIRGYIAAATRSFRMKNVLWGSISVQPWLRMKVCASRRRKHCKPP